MTNDELIEKAKAAGWEFRPIPMYDEEGVEGFEWTGPQGQECWSHAVDGDWANGPEVPDEVRLAVDPEFQAEVDQRREKARQFAQFIEGLVGQGEGES